MSEKEQKALDRVCDHVEGVLEGNRDYFKWARANDGMDAEEQDDERQVEQLGLDAALLRDCVAIPRKRYEQLVEIEKADIGDSNVAKIYNDPSLVLVPRDELTRYKKLVLSLLKQCGYPGPETTNYDLRVLLLAGGLIKFRVHAPSDRGPTWQWTDEAHAFALSMPTQEDKP